MTSHASCYSQSLLLVSAPGIAIVALQEPLLWLGFLLITPPQESFALTETYAGVQILATPASLGGLCVTGRLIGTQQASIDVTGQRLKCWPQFRLFNVNSCPHRFDFSGFPESWSKGLVASRDGSGRSANTNLRRIFWRRYQAHNLLFVNTGIAGYTGTRLMLDGRKLLLFVKITMHALTEVPVINTVNK